MIERIDHVHLYVDDLLLAEQWYQRLLGFERDPELITWFHQGGPLVIKTQQAALSLFPRQAQPPGATVVFLCQAEKLKVLIDALTLENITFDLVDHQQAISIYFHDPSSNRLEVTCYDYLSAKRYCQL